MVRLAYPACERGDESRPPIALLLEVMSAESLLRAAHEMTETVYCPICEGMRETAEDDDGFLACVECGADVYEPPN